MKRYTLKHVIETNTDARLDGREGDLCYAGQNKSAVLDAARGHDKTKLKRFVGICDDGFHGPFIVDGPLGTMEAFYLIFRRPDDEEERSEN